MPLIRFHINRSSLTLLTLSSIATLFSLAQNTSFHNAPLSAQQTKNPFAGQATEAAAGKLVYEQNCITCHGANGKGTGNVPPLATGAAQTASDGDIFWYITRGDLNNGMPSWSSMPVDQRWQVITFIKSLGSSATDAAAASSGTAMQSSHAKSSAPPPKAPFTDYRYESPGTIRWIRLKDLPSPPPMNPLITVPGLCRALKTRGRRLRKASRWGCMRQG